MKHILKIGTRSSPLALLQAQSGAEEWVYPCRDTLDFTLIPFSTPGDRDQTTDLRTAPVDFFTADLDDALRNRTLDCAIHSAKDLPDPLPEDIDFCWLPTREDPRDAIVCRKGVSPETARVIGISSDRRNAWARSRFPNAEFKVVRGSINRRLEQLDAGAFDLLLIATAALNRLGMSERITQIIPSEELTPPEGQGVLAITFLKGNRAMERLRQAIVYPVILAGAGPGDESLLTLGAVNALRGCDICLCDALGFHDLNRYLKPGATSIFVGKRMGGHTLKQDGITQLLVQKACQGGKVVRLKGGDPGLFGRLAEEVEALSAHRLPFRVIPGISAMNAATTGTGLLPTRRGVSRGLTLATPRTGGAAAFVSISAEEQREMPHLFFMSAGESAALCESQIAAGLSPDTPAAAVFDASLPSETVLTGTLADLPAKVTAFSARFEQVPPGLILTGKVFDSRFLYPHDGLLGGMRVLLTGSDALQESASAAVRRYNGIPVPCPLIELKIRPEAAEAVRSMEADWLLVSSPSAAEFVLKTVKDLRRLPKIMVCGAGISRIFRSYGIIPDAEPSEAFGNTGLVPLIEQVIHPGDRVVRIRSDLASVRSGEKVRSITSSYSEIVFADTVSVKQERLPPHDILFLASASAVHSLAELGESTVMKPQYIVVIGKPTARALFDTFPSMDPLRVTIPDVSTSLGAFEALVVRILNNTLTYSEPELNALTPEN